MVRLALLLIRLMHVLPRAALARLGAALGALLHALARSRRNVVLTNLRLCFPDLQAADRRRIARDHFRAFGCSLLEHGILWWGAREDVQALISIEGLEHWRGVTDRPVILLAPHFIGLDMGGSRLVMDFKLNSFYSRQKNAAADEVILRGRMRFGDATLFARQEGIRPMIRALKNGEPLYYLPDMDLGPRDSVFAPFFGVETATITALSRIAGMTGAVIVPCVTRRLPGSAGYVVKMYPAWRDFPGDDLVADAQRMNAFIEERVREMPEQYYWLHKRFKTRPAGEPNPYER